MSHVRSNILLTFSGSAIYPGQTLRPSQGLMGGWSDRGTFKRGLTLELGGEMLCWMRLFISQVTATGAISLTRDIDAASLVIRQRKSILLSEWYTSAKKNFSNEEYPRSDG